MQRFTRRVRLHRLRGSCGPSRVLPPPGCLGLAAASSQLASLPDGVENELPAWQQRLNRKAFLLIVAYDGTDFSGWQAQRGQPELRTVQHYLERALSTRLQISPGELALTASGRTDAGVHALGQAAAFSYNADIPRLADLSAGLNRLLPDDIRVRSVRAVPPTFAVRHSAIWREYHYSMAWGDAIDPRMRRHVLHLGDHVEHDLMAMARAIETFEGEHNFDAFCNHDAGEQGPNIRRVLHARLHVQGCTACAKVRRFLVRKMHAATSAVTDAPNQA